MRTIHADLIRRIGKHTDFWLLDYVRKKGYGYALYLMTINEYRDFRIGDYIFYRKHIIDKIMDDNLKNNKKSYVYQP